MNYNKLNKFPEHNKNPFLEDTMHQVQEKTRNKKVFVKGNKSLTNYIMDDNGEIRGESAFIQTKQVDEEQFVKLYVKGFSAFYELSVPGRKVLGYILSKCIVPNRDVFYIDFDEAKEFTGYMGENSIRSGFSSLIGEGLIARTPSPYKYFLNPQVIFNGDRISFVNNYSKNNP